jgi:Kef-type K+ transport system membrane component KefB
MVSLELFLLSLGGILFLGLLTSTIGLRTFLPRATILLLLGLVLGPGVGKVLPPVFIAHFDVLADMTLMMVGFLWGGKLRIKDLRNAVKTIFAISISAAVLTAAIVCIGLIWLGVDAPLAILLGAIAAATDAAAIADVVDEAKVDNEFSRSLISIVALDDVWALLIFAVALSVVANLGTSGNDLAHIVYALKEIAGAVLLGIALGIPTAFLTGRIHNGQPMLLEALGAVCICGGLALWLGYSYLVACLVLGLVVANLAKHHDRPFDAIRDIESMFLIVFFVVAGASLDLSSLWSVGYLGAAYICLRCMGKYFGSWIGGYLVGGDKTIVDPMRLALLPQAGVSIGMALVAGLNFPEYKQILLVLVLASTVVFEIVGPVFTRIALTIASRGSSIIPHNKKVK